MKIALLALSIPLLALTGLAADADSTRRKPSPPATTITGAPQTFSSLDKPSGKPSESLPADALKFEDADIAEVLKIYQTLSRRTVVRSAALPLSKVTLQTEMPLTIHKALQTLDTVLAQNGIAMIPQGTDIVKAVPANAAQTEAVPICDLPPDQIPESASYTCYIVELKNRRPRDLAQALQPFAKLPNSIIGIDDGGLLILRDYAVNIRRMLQLIERLDKLPRLDGDPPKDAR